MKKYNDAIHPIGDENVITIGLTKREYFAAIAMQGLLANSYKTPLSLATKNQIAEIAVFNANALIEALNRKSDE